MSLTCKSNSKSFCEADWGQFFIFSHFHTDMDFNSFLTSKLKEKKIDTSVYHSYLLGILEDTIEEDEKREMILDIIGSLIVSLSA